MKKKFLAAFVMAAVVLLTGCGNKMADGYYTAEMSGFSHGWKEYVCIQVKDDTIVSAEFNAKDESGFIKAWDNEYMRNMSSKERTYPNKYTREYVQQLIEGQRDTKVDILSGATHSGENFTKLIEAAMKQAEQGDSTTILVEMEAEEE